VPRAFAHPELGRVGLHLMYLEFWAVGGPGRRRIRGARSAEHDV